VKVIFKGTKTIKGKRTNLTTQEVSEVELSYYVELGSLFRLWFHIQPGVTGYESFEFCPDANSNIKLKGWVACVGTPGSWDRLEISPEEMTAAIENMETVIQDYREKKELGQVCTVASDYLGLPPEECKVSFDNKPGDGCSYYKMKEDDPEHPSVLPRICGNCIHWVVLEESK